MKKYVVPMSLIVAVCLTACGKQEAADETVMMQGENMIMEESVETEESLGSILEETPEETNSDEVVSNDMVEESDESVCPFQLMDSFVPDGFFRTYSGGTSSYFTEARDDITVNLNEEEQILSVVGNAGTDVEGDSLVVDFASELSRGVYTSQMTGNDDADTGYFVQQGEYFDLEKEAVVMWRYYGTKYQEKSYDVLELNRESETAILYRFSPDGEKLEAQEEYTFKYWEEENKLVFYEAEEIAAVWDMEMSNGVAVLETSHYGLIGALARIEGMPASVEPAIAD